MKFTFLLTIAVLLASSSTAIAATCDAASGNTNPPSWADPDKYYTAVRLKNPHAGPLDCTPPLPYPLFSRMLTTPDAGTSGEECYSINSIPYCVSESGSKKTVKGVNGVTFDIDTMDFVMPDGTTGNLVTDADPLRTMTLTGTVLAATKTVATRSTASSAVSSAKSSAVSDAASSAVATAGAASSVKSAATSATSSAAAAGAAERRTVGMREVVLGVVGVAAAAAVL